jgi:S1-C subfamily serine protease
LRVWFGTVPEYASDEKGLLLAGTSPGSPAERAGLLQGDLIVQIGDLPIASIYDFMYALEIHKPGDVVHTRYVRDGRVEEVPVTLHLRRTRSNGVVVAQRQRATNRLVSPSAAPPRLEANTR